MKKLYKHANTKLTALDNVCIKQASVPLTTIENHLVACLKYFANFHSRATFEKSCNAAAYFKQIINIALLQNTLSSLDVLSTRAAI